MTRNTYYSEGFIGDETNTGTRLRNRGFLFIKYRGLNLAIIQGSSLRLKEITSDQNHLPCICAYTLDYVMEIEM